MSLIVALFDPNSETHSFVEEPRLLGHDAAGFESYRHELWGSASMEQRTRFLRDLKTRGLFIVPTDLDAFGAECDMLLREADVVAHEVWDKTCTDEHVHGIRGYAQNFLRAIEYAKARNLGVYIG